MLKSIAVSITSALVRFSVPLAWTGITPSERSHLIMSILLTTRSRIKEKLRSGEIAVSGDQWPILLYADHSYDPDDPWNGLLRNRILVQVNSL
jgi:hypothetical protein